MSNTYVSVNYYVPDPGKDFLEVARTSDNRKILVAAAAGIEADRIVAAKILNSDIQAVIIADENENAVSCVAEELDSAVKAISRCPNRALFMSFKNEAALLTHLEAALNKWPLSRSSHVLLDADIRQSWSTLSMVFNPHFGIGLEIRHVPQNGLTRRWHIDEDVTSDILVRSFSKHGVWIAENFNILERNAETIKRVQVDQCGHAGAGRYITKNSTIHASPNVLENRWVYLLYNKSHFSSSEFDFRFT